MASESPAKPSAPSRMPLAKVSTAGSCSAPTQGVREVSAPTFPSSLVEAIRATVHALPVPEISRRTGIPAKLLYRVAYDPENPSDQHRHLPADLIPALVKATGRPDVLEVLAAQTGHVLVPMPQPVPGSLQLLSRVGALTRELAEVQAATADALADGLTPAERKALVKELGDVLRAASGLLLGLQQGAA